MCRAVAVRVAVNVIIALVATHTTPALGQQPDALVPVQGRWVVIGGEHDDEPMDGSTAE